MRRTLVLLAALSFIALLLPSAPRASTPLPEVENICCILVYGASIDDLNGRWGTYVIDFDESARMYLLGVSQTTDVERLSKDMRRDPAVELIEPDRRLETPEGVRQMVLAAVGGEWEDFAAQDFTGRVGLDLAHEMSRGAGVVIAVLDTGIDPDHPAFAGRLVPGYDSIDKDDDPREETNGVDDDRDGAIDEGYGHGTMVAGLIALVAPDARIMPVRVLNDEGRGTIFSVARGMMRAMSHGAQVINMSFGAPQVMEIIEKKLRVADTHRAITIAGAGNRGLEYPPYHPACDLYAHMVLATDSLDVKADFSDYHSTALISAPGVAVRSAYPGNEWAIGSGCSFATPIVSGTVALMLELAPEMSAPQFEQRVAAGAVAIDALPGNEPYAGKLGAGRIDIGAAVWSYASDVAGTAPAVVLPRVWPNPSSGPVQFRLGERASASRLVILDASGRVVRELGGRESLRWDGRDAFGRDVAPGIYWARIMTGSHTDRLELAVIR